MLYLTTRSCHDAHTSFKTLSCDYAEDGGCFLPLVMPQFSSDELSQLKNTQFNQIIADVLNRFFASRLTRWDIDFCIGRDPICFKSMSHRIVVSELWRNAGTSFVSALTNLYIRIVGEYGSDKSPTEWFETAVRIAYLFGIYGQMLSQELVDRSSTFDYVVDASNHTAWLAAVYAKEMGIPLGTIIVTTNDDSTIWDFIHRGSLNPNTTEKRLFSGIERFVHARLGQREALRLARCADDKCIFSLDEEQADLLGAGLFCAVTGNNRSDSIINSVFRSNAYIMDPYCAVCYGGLQDYRAKTGGNRLTLLSSEHAPQKFYDRIRAATGLTAQQWMEYNKS